MQKKEIDRKMAQYSVAVNLYDKGLRFSSWQEEDEEREIYRFILSSLFGRWLLLASCNIIHKTTKGESKKKLEYAELAADSSLE